MAKQAPAVEVTQTQQPARVVFKRGKKLSQNQLKLSIGKPVFVKLVSEIYTGKEIPGEKKQAAQLVDAIDLETGEECLIVVPKVVESTLDEAYPGKTYVGKAFEIEKLEQTNPSKKYFPYAVTELELDE